jgi:RHS repeat-associated protein
MDYTYDDVGNRMTEVIDDDSYTYSYVPGTNIIDTITDTDTIIYTHDANGNITGIGNEVLTYNQNNRLVMVEEDSVVFGEYTYNGLGQRIIKEAEGVTTIFHYDFDGNIIAESDISGNFDKEYLYRGSSRLALVDVGTGELYYYGNDQLGTPQILTDSTNTVVWEAVYDPFGQADINPNSTVVSNFRFPGQYYDSETELHYNYHRYYDPGTGRYLSADLIGLRGGVNLYTYAENNPINKMDLFGWQTQWPVRGTPVIKSRFGPRAAPVPGASEFHEGIDLRLPLGEAAVASDSGFVYQAGPARGGNRVMLHHDDGSWSWYRHITPTVVPQQRVEAGQEVGLSDGSMKGDALNLLT